MRERNPYRMRWHLYSTEKKKKKGTEMHVKFNIVYILKKTSYNRGIYMKEMDILLTMYILKSIRLDVSCCSNKYEFHNILRVLTFYFAVVVN